MQSFQFGSSRGNLLICGYVPFVHSLFMYTDYSTAPNMNWCVLKTAGGLSKGCFF